jgi:hypothetical protein
VPLHLQDPAPLRVEYDEWFFDTFMLLDGSAATFRAVMELLDHALLEGEGVPLVRTSNMRVLRTTADSGLPLVRLYFSIEYGKLTYVLVQYYNEHER